ncbi:hypothetical protein BZG36_03393 [Bifiguratus adelaidae]|uniref:Major facilitator superfamily (MFS) profile domain-containing protein n=1 Tax=Bifiguratus adelaidae TaxID=1938954 RepID=A0A261Y0J3_9FUNG|nr:hypothetical protein BZG36_03393 [Bifiguratus adelaidae]
MDTEARETVYMDPVVEKQNEVDEKMSDPRKLTLEDVLPANAAPWYKTRHLLLLNLSMIVCFLSSTTNGYDGSLLNGLQAMTQWEDYFNHPTGGPLGALVNGVIFGQIIAFPVTPWICDHMGRRFPIFFGSLLLVIGAILQAASQDFAMFLVSRMIIGFGGLIAVIPSPMLVSEIAYPTHRHILTAIYNTLWYLGALVAAAITLRTSFMPASTSWAWRIPSLMQGFFPLLQVIFIYFLPESPRYLVYKGKVEEARRTLLKHHAGGAEQSALVDFEMNEIMAAIEAEKAQKSTSYLEFFKTKGNRHRLFLVCMIPAMMQLSGNGLVSYYLSQVLDSIGITDATIQLQINLGLTVYNLVVSFAAASTVERFGRRGLFLFSTVGMLTSFIIWTILSALNQQQGFVPALGNGVLAMIFLFYLCYNAGMNAVPYLYLTEVLSYSLRAKGINIMQIVATIALIYNGFVNTIAMSDISWRYYIVYICIIAVEVVAVYFFFPETKGRTLEEVALVLDGKNDPKIQELVKEEEA